ncbi:MAG: response regulator [Elusimicrobia bacterium]|nr:response regulator [Elusimicrobiota bacterium]
MATILVIDDDSTLRGAIALMISSRGHTVIQAPDAHTGVITARRQPPDLIISDMQMPGGGAPLIIKSLDDQPHLAKIPVILISSMPADKLKDWVPESGLRRYHPKPLKWDLLGQQVDELLAPKR